jgi:simple sugar transport system permease protein
METLFSESFLTSLLFGAVTAGVPLMLAGLGEQISEKPACSTSESRG